MKHDEPGLCACSEETGLKKILRRGIMGAGDLRREMVRKFAKGQYHQGLKLSKMSNQSEVV